MTRYPFLLTILTLVLFMAVVAAMLLGWQPDMATGLIALALIVVVLDVALIVVLWKRRRE